MVSGQETNRQIISEVINSSPVNEIYLRGTRTLPRNTVSTETATYGNFIWPVNRSVGKISELTAWDGGYSSHSGIDIAAPYGSPIYAGASGTVQYAGWSYGYGNYVVILHSNGLKTYYAHCSSLEVYTGQEVLQGQCVGLVGATGIAYGNHVHFEVRRGNSILNPLTFLDYSSADFQ